jgi:hypothetical protein
MAAVTIDVELPPRVTITTYLRHDDGHGLKVSWPWPARCRCDSCRKEDDAYLEVKDTVQVVRDLDLWGQPGFWIYQSVFHRCPWCHHRQHLIPPFKRNDTGYTYGRYLSDQADAALAVYVVWENRAGQKEPTWAAVPPSYFGGPSFASLPEDLLLTIIPELAAGKQSAWDSAAPRTHEWVGCASCR